MNFGYFDDKRKEYVITRPDTPLSWSNYLGSTTYGAIITNNAGGYSFYKSAAQGRFMRYRTNSIPMDQPGRYIYVHDCETKDFWSTSWQPIGKPLDKYKSECRHGSAYSIIESEYAEILTNTRYFVPLGSEHEYWQVKVSNKSNKKRKLRLFTYVEFASHWVLSQDIINLQYTQYVLKMDLVNNIISAGTNVNLPHIPEEFENDRQSRYSFIGVAGATPSGFDTDRKAFLGTYRSYHNPVVVENGQCTGSCKAGDNGCGTIQIEIELEAGETKEFVVVLGVGKADTVGIKAIKEASDINAVNKKFDELVNFWHSRLEGMHVKSPDSMFDSMFNMWNPYNSMMTFTWSRAASLIYAGERDGLGYRDTVQDILGVIHLVPEEARQRLELMITGQVSTGGAMPVVKQFGHYPGKMPKTEETEYRSDDCMWLFNTIPAYVKETGDISFYRKVLPYSDKGEATVLGHLRRAIEFNLERSGAHGLPCGLVADWNDCLVLGHKGETVFVALQLRYALKEYAEICELLGESAEKQWALEKLAILDKNIEEHAWDGKWYLRAYREDGLKFGADGDEEGSLWLNPQSWAVLSGHANAERSVKVMNMVKERLATDYGTMICDPPYKKADLNVIKATLFNPGSKENGAIFCHTQGWVVLAETLTGNGNRAFEYYKAYLPASCNDKAEIREIEPYVYSQSTHSKYHDRYGASRLPWLTGAATWAYFAASQGILGIKPDYNGIVIDPCIPEGWGEFSVIRRFRGKKLNITVKNPDKKQKGVKQLVVNGEKLGSNFIPVEKLNSENQIEVIL
jgi:cellobiose phosphorylase